MGDFIRNLIIGVVVLVLLFVAAGFVLNKSTRASNLGAIGSVHWHVDFLVYIDGQPVNFNQQKYFVRSPYVHVEPDNVGGAGKVIHVHATGVPLGMFFESMGMKFSPDCFKLDSGQSFCSQGAKHIRLYVNGRLNEEYENYVPQNMDKVLIVYGDENEEEIQHHLALVPDMARLQ